jgi:hypothetical protein
MNRSLLPSQLQSLITRLITGVNGTQNKENVPSIKK